MRQLHTMDGVINILLPIRRLRSHESLMNGQANQPHAIYKRMPLELAQIFGPFTGHLHVQHIYTLHAQFGRVIDHFFDRIFVPRKMPVGIGGQRQLVARGGGCRGQR